MRWISNNNVNYDVIHCNHYGSSTKKKKKVWNHVVDLDFKAVFKKQYATQLAF